jgi:hypothetical protein
MQKLAIGIISAALVTPALAIAPEEQDAITKRCSVVAEKPMSPSIIVGSFKSRAEAESSMRTAAMCSSH